ncbi:MAG: carbohydrate ABC transporter permease [Spirochaetia bacterium]
MGDFSLSIVISSLTQVSLTVLALIGALIILELFIWLVSGKLFKNKFTLVWMLLAPAIIGIALLVVYPILFEVGLAFSNMSLRHFRDPSFGLMEGFANFRRIFTAPVLQRVTFFPLLGRTILWTFVQVVFHVVGGMVLALLLNQKIKLKNLYKTLLILPWAVPQVIAALAWRGEFHYEYGAFNIILRNIGLTAIQWKSSPLWNWIAMNLVNIWMGIPFMMVIILGGLQSIDSAYYEASDIDGASGLQKFNNITLPLLQPVLAPAVILGVIWTFNNFNVPYFINEQELETSDILVTALFRAAFEYNQYGFAAAFAIVIFMILFAFSVFYLNYTGALKGVRD